MRTNLKLQKPEKTKAEIAFEMICVRQWAQSGIVTWWSFEPVKFRLAYNTTYTPDYLVLSHDGQLFAYDVKAYWKKAGRVGVTEDAMVKIKVAAEAFPWVRWRLTWSVGGRHEYRPVNGDRLEAWEEQK